MSWHRIIRLEKKNNVYFHFIIESYDNMGLVTTLKKDKNYLILECTTSISNLKFYDKVIEEVIREINDRN